MNGKSDRPISFSVSFCICGRSFKLLSFTFVCERETQTLGAVHSTQLWVLVKYITIFNLNISKDVKRSLTKPPYKFVKSKDCVTGIFFADIIKAGIKWDQTKWHENFAVQVK